MRFKKPCDNCTKEFSLNTNSQSFLSYPVIVHCPHCKTANSFTDLKYQKVSPDDASILDGTILIDSTQESPELTDSSTVESLHDYTEVKQDESLPFFVLANKLGQNTRDNTLLANRLKNEIDNFTTYVTRHFESQWQYATQFARCWRPGYMQEFLSFPFISIPVNCEDSLAAVYSRWVLSPKFFDAGLGYKLHAAGGMRLELVNQYSRLQFKFDPAIAVKLGVPPDLELQVRGGKIIGPSLRYCWNEIPGTVKDADHSDTMPSIFIRNNMLAKTWLARHGVPPHEPLPIKPEDLLILSVMRELGYDMHKKPHIEQAWRLFSDTGRVAVYWNNSIECRRFAYLAASYIKGPVAIFTADEETIGAWKILYSSNYNKSNDVATRFSNKIVYFVNGKEPVWRSIPQCKLIIIDHYKEIDPEIIDKLFGYSGRLILLAKEPVFDVLTTNITAAKLHALAPYQVQEFEPDEAWPESKIKDLPELQASLINLTDSAIKKQIKSFQ